MRTVLATFLLTLPLAEASAQDMVAVSWTGRVHALDSSTGALTEIGIGPMGANAMARDETGRLWSTARLLPNFFLTRIDAVTGAVAFSHLSIDLRCLAEAGAGALWGVESQGGAPSRLWRIDTATGVHTLIGSVGSTLVQALASHQGVLYAWHPVNGLVVLDPVTGLLSDPFVAGTGGQGIQWLGSHPAGGLIGGTIGLTPRLVRIDTATGVVTPGAMLPASADLRGAEFASFAMPFGSGCVVGNGPLTLRAIGTLAPGQTVTVASTNHLPQTMHAFAMGLSRTSWNGQPLPLLLDPLTGSVGCRLYTSLEVTQLHFGSGFPTTTMSLPFALPTWIGAVDLHVQHFDLNQPWNPPGSSNGLLLHIRP